MRSSRLLLRLLPAGLLLAATAPAQTILPPFNAAWQASDLGPMPNVHNYGGIAFVPGAPNTLLVSAYGSGQIRAVTLVRDADDHIVGFAGSTLHATVGGNDGGLAFGPGGVLFFTWYGANRLGQIRPGSTSADRLIDLAPLGVSGSVGTCAFVPPGRDGAGRFKLVSYAGSRCHDATLVPAGDGTFTLGAVTHTATLQGGPEGLPYPPTSAPLLPQHVLVAEWNAGVFAYRTDANGDPLPATRQPFLAGLSGNAGGAIDPVTGDLLFSGNGGRLCAVRAFASCGALTAYGPATPGTTVTPALTAAGCARLGGAVTFDVVGAPHALGVLVAGDWQLQIDLGGFVLLTSLDVQIPHLLDATGRFSLPYAVPADPALGNAHVYVQAGYLDAGTPFGFSGTAGLDVWIR